LVSRIATARAAIVSFDVQIAAKVTLHRKLEPDEDRLLWEYDLRLAMDIPESRVHVARRDIYANVPSLEVDERDETTWQLFVETAEWRMERQPPHGAAIRSSGIGSRPRVEFFDPRAVGLAFCGDIKASWPLERTVANYLQWSGKYERTDQGGGLVRLASPDQHFHLLVDTKKDYWPIELVLKSGEAVLSKTTVELTNAGDCWVPRHAKVECPDATTELSFRWVSVNAPLPATLFDPSSVARQYSFRVTDLRQR